MIIDYVNQHKKLAELSKNEKWTSVNCRKQKNENAKEDSSTRGAVVTQKIGGRTKIRANKNAWVCKDSLPWENDVVDARIVARVDQLVRVLGVSKTIDLRLGRASEELMTGSTQRQRHHCSFQLLRLPTIVNQQPGKCKSVERQENHVEIYDLGKWWLLW